LETDFGRFAQNGGSKLETALRLVPRFASDKRLKCMDEREKSEKLGKQMSMRSYCVGEMLGTRIRKGFRGARRVAN